MNAGGRLVAVDIGNTAVKWGRWSWAEARAAATPAAMQTVGVADRDGSPELLQLARSGEPIVVGSVNREVWQELRSRWLHDDASLAARLIELTHRDFHFPIRVQSPERVGIDRLADAAAVGRLKSVQHAAICIDAGSAITVDFVHEDGGFEGGAIAPGRRLLTQALGRGTSLLPELDPQLLAEDVLPGKTTEQAIAAGIGGYLAGGVSRLIERLEQATSASCEVFLTGGDADCLRVALERRWPALRRETALALRGMALVGAERLSTHRTAAT